MWCATMSELVKSLDMCSISSPESHKKIWTKSNGMAKMFNCTRSMNVVAHGIAWHFINESLSGSAISVFYARNRKLIEQKFFLFCFWFAVGWQAQSATKERKKNFCKQFFLRTKTTRKKNANSLSSVEKRGR